MDQPTRTLMHLTSDFSYLHTSLLALREVGRGRTNPITEGDAATLKASYEVLHDMLTRWAGGLQLAEARV